jgi:glycosyltransferase involved in cell wall biosynthesis
VRLLILAAQYFPAVGGSEVQTRLLAREFKRRGHEVEVWTRRLLARDAPLESLDGVTVRRLGLTLASTPSWVRSLERADFVLRLYFQLRSKVRQFDLVLANQLQYPAVAAVLARRGTGVPVIARSAASGPEGAMRRSEWAFRIQKWFLKRDLDRVVALGPVTRADCEEAGFKPERLVIVPNGIEIPTLSPHARNPVSPMRVLWLGKLRKEKRPDLAIRAWHEAGISGSLILVGDGDERDAIEALVAAGRERGRAIVLMKGLLEDPRPELEAAHVFVQSSDTEGLSNALLEAMAAGCACVATDVGETRFVLGGDGGIAEGSFLRAEAGLLVRPGDVTGIAEALRALVDQELRDSLGRAGARRCRENHGIANVAQRYEEVFAGLVSVAQTPRSE